MPDHIPPGAPPEGAIDVESELLSDFADKAARESIAVGDVRRLVGVTRTEKAVPGAKLISGCIALRQSTEDKVAAIFDELNQLYLDIHKGLSTIGQADRDNAAGIGRAGHK